MTELSFLIELLLNEALPKELKIIVKDRIKEVECKIQPPAPVRQASVAPLANGQSPSTQKILDEMAAEQGVLVASPVAAMAMQSRAEAIRSATSGKAEPGRTSPRKF